MFIYCQCNDLDLNSWYYYCEDEYTDEYVDLFCNAIFLT